MKRLEIKQAIAEQVRDIVALDRLCFGGLWTKEGYLREMDSPNSSILILWLRETDTFARMIGVGCLWSILEEAHITLLGIHPRYQKQGLGMLLLYSLLQDGYGRGLARATLEVRVSNAPAIQLYQKFGFKIAGKRRNYYKQTGEDAFVLWLSGLDKPDFEKQLNHWQRYISDRLSANYICPTIQAKN